MWWLGEICLRSWACGRVPDGVPERDTMSAICRAGLRPATLRRQRPVWAWAEALDLQRAPDALLRRLPRYTADLAQLLCSHERRHVEVDYGRLSAQLGLSRRQVGARLRLLRELGAFEVRERRWRSGVVDMTVWPTVTRERHGTQMVVYPLSSWCPTAEGVAVYVPGEVLARMADHKSAGGKRPGAGRRAKSKTSPLDSGVSAKWLISDEDEKSKTSPFSNTLNSESGSDSKNGAERAPCGATMADLTTSADVDSQPADDLDRALALLDSIQPPASARRPLPLDKRGPRPIIPAKDPIPRLAQGHPALPENAPDAFRAQFVAEAFNAAHLAVYGRRAFAFAKGNIERSRWFAGLVAAAAKLDEHAISPRAWAEWRLRYSKEQGRRMTLMQVFSAAVIERQHGFFRASADQPRGYRLAPERWHIEQFLREREALRRWEWGDSGDPNEVHYVGPDASWYYAMRRQERRAGFLDPLDCWTSRQPVQR